MGLMQEEFLSAFSERADDLVRKAGAVGAAAERRVLRDVEVAYGRIEARAGALVEKAGGRLSRDAAIDRVLRSRERAALYSRYVAATERVGRVEEVVKSAQAERDADLWRLERAGSRILKAAQAGADPGEQALRELADPALARACGVAPVSPVEKGASAWSEIERRAEQLVAKSGGLTQARAVDQVLRDDPALYTAYVREAGLA